MAETYATAQSREYAQAVAKLVAKMPIERAAEVYDFARFLQDRPAFQLPADQPALDWLGDSEEQMRAEDAQWEAAVARHPDKFDALAEAARVEIAAGASQPMFDDHGEFLPDELAHHA
jgi:hypothetical protein